MSRGQVDPKIHDANEATEDIIAHIREEIRKLSIERARLNRQHIQLREKRANLQNHQQDFATAAKSALDLLNAQHSKNSLAGSLEKRFLRAESQLQAAEQDFAKIEQERNLAEYRLAEIEKAFYHDLVHKVGADSAQTARLADNAFENQNLSTQDKHTEASLDPPSLGSADPYEINFGRAVPYGCVPATTIEEALQQYTARYSTRQDCAIDERIPVVPNELRQVDPAYHQVTTREAKERPQRNFRDRLLLQSGHAHADVENQRGSESHAVSTSCQLLSHLLLEFNSGPDRLDRWLLYQLRTSSENVSYLENILAKELQTEHPIDPETAKLVLEKWITDEAHIEQMPRFKVQHESLQYWTISHGKFDRSKSSGASGTQSVDMNHLQSMTTNESQGQTRNLCAFPKEPKRRSLLRYSSRKSLKNSPPLRKLSTHSTHFPHPRMAPASVSAESDGSLTTSAWSSESFGAADREAFSEFTKLSGSNGPSQHMADRCVLNPVILPSDFVVKSNPQDFFIIGRVFQIEPLQLQSLLSTNSEAMNLHLDQQVANICYEHHIKLAIISTDAYEEKSVCCPILTINNRDSIEAALVLKRLPVVYATDSGLGRGQAVLPTTEDIRVELSDAQFRFIGDTRLAPRVQLSVAHSFPVREIGRITDLDLYHFLSLARDVKETPYPIFSTRQDSASFFSVGRAFSMIWHEPADQRIPRTQSVAKKLQRMIVAKAGKDLCWCLPINTYNGRGTLAPQLDANQVECHAIIHLKDQPPLRFSQERGMKREPIALIPAIRSQEWHPASRLDFGRAYTIEHIIAQVINLGKLTRSSQIVFEGYWKDEKGAHGA